MTWQYIDKTTDRQDSRQTKKKQQINKTMGRQEKTVGRQDS